MHLALSKYVPPGTRVQRQNSSSRATIAGLNSEHNPDRAARPDTFAIQTKAKFSPPLPNLSGKFCKEVAPVPAPFPAQTRGTPRRQALSGWVKANIPFPPGLAQVRELLFTVLYHQLAKAMATAEMLSQRRRRSLRWCRRSAIRKTERRGACTLQCPRLASSGLRPV